MKSWILAALLAASSAASAQTGPSHSGHTDQAVSKRPMILEGYGNGGFAIRTASPQAQAFFNNGMQLAAAFAHKAAIDAMQEAVRLDDRCAMCSWGLAWASGPTINYGLEPEELREAQRLAANAERLASRYGSKIDRMLTRALVKRYRNGGGGQAGDRAFARAMEQIATQYPANDAFAYLAADAWMQAAAEDDEKGTEANSAHAAALLEPILARNPTYTPAIHFYIHATEIARFGSRAEPFADRLGALAPRSQHLVHMPSHTFYWVGRYADAARVNRQAVELGIEQAKALGGSPPEGVFGLPYHAHNVTFGLGGALMAGDAQTALWLAGPLIAKATTDTKANPYAQALAGSAYVAVAEFSEPIEVLKIAPPRLPYLLGMWHYARAEAYVRQGNAGLAKREGARIAVPPSQDKGDRSWHGAQTLKIAQAVVQGRIGMIEGRHEDAIAAFKLGTDLQEQPDYSEAADPPLWWFPVRRKLAEAKLAAGDQAGARSDAVLTLQVRPKDPGALAMIAKFGAAPVR